MAGFTEDFGFENQDSGASTPRVGRQAGLDARLRDKGRRVPSVRRGDLWQEEAAPAAVFDNHAVPADDHVGGGCHLAFGSQYRDLDLESIELARTNGVEAGIGIGDGCSQLRDCGSQRLVGIQATEATAQIAVTMNRNKGARGQIQGAASFRRWRRLAADAGLDRSPGERQQPLLVVRGNHQIAAAM